MQSVPARRLRRDVLVLGLLLELLQNLPLVLPSALLLLRYRLLQIAALGGKHLPERRRFGLPLDLAPFVDDVAQPGARFNGKSLA